MLLCLSDARLNIIITIFCNDSHTRGRNSIICWLSDHRPEHSYFHNAAQAQSHNIIICWLSDEGPKQYYFNRNLLLLSPPEADSILFNLHLLGSGSIAEERIVLSEAETISFSQHQMSRIVFWSWLYKPKLVLFRALASLEHHCTRE